MKGLKAGTPFESQSIALAQPEASRLGLWALILSLFLVFSQNSFAKEESDLVNVNKDSKLSDYFQKLNNKMSNDPEEVGIAEKKPKLAEEEILLKEASQKKEGDSSMSPYQKMIASIFALVFVAVLLLLGMNKVSRKKGYASISQNIKILTQKSLGPKKNLMLVRVAGETILLGVTDHNINHIKTLSLMDDELPEYTEPQFRNQLKQKIDETKMSDDVEEVDGFAVSRLDDVKQAVTKRFSI